MSPPNPLVPPTARRHPTLFTYPARYHNLLIIAIIALLALTVAPAANAADIPPHYRQYRYTRSLAPEHVKRRPAARPGHMFWVPSLEKRAIDRPSNSDKNKINSSNWMQYFSNIAKFIEWWIDNFNTTPSVSGNGNSNGKGDGDDDGNNGNGNGNAKKTTSTTPARTTATPAATTRPQSTTRAQVVSVPTTSPVSVSTSPAPSSPTSSSHEQSTSTAPQTIPAASGSSSVASSNTSKSLVASGNGQNDGGGDGNDSSTNRLSSLTQITGISPSSSTIGSGPTNTGDQTTNSEPDRKWIIGLVIGLLLLSFTCCGLGYIFFRRRRARDREREQTSTTSSEVHIIEKGQETGMVHTQEQTPIVPPLPPITFAALPPAVPVPVAAAAAAADSRRDSRRISRLSAANTRPTTPSSYLSSEFSEKSLFQYEPDPSIGIPVDYPIAIHVPPRVAKALAKRDAARLANEQLERELAERERAMYLQPGPSRVTNVSDVSSGGRNTDGHGSYFGVPPTAYNYNQFASVAGSSNAHTIGHGGSSDQGHRNRWSAASSRLSGTMPIHEAFPLPPEPTTTPRSAAFRLGSMAAIASVSSSDSSVDRGQRRVSHPLPPIPQQEDDPFRDTDASAVPSSSTQLHNPFNPGRASQGSMITHESTNTGEGGSSHETHVVGAVTATARVTPAARVVYSTASSGSNTTILAYARSSDANPAPLTVTDSNADLNPFGDQHGFPMRSQVADTGVVTTGVDEGVHGQATEQHDESQRGSTPTSTTSQTSSTPGTFGR